MVTGVWTPPVADADLDAAVPWVASPFVPGPNLRQAAGAAGAFPESAALRLGADLAAAPPRRASAGGTGREQVR